MRAEPARPTEPHVNLCLAMVCFGVGIPLTLMWRRHRSERAARGAAGEYLPRVDAKGIWLTMNGPLTVALGVVLLVAALMRP